MFSVTGVTPAWGVQLQHYCARKLVFILLKNTKHWTYDYIFKIPLGNSCTHRSYIVLKHYFLFIENA